MKTTQTNKFTLSDDYGAPELDHSRELKTQVDNLRIHPTVLRIAIFFHKLKKGGEKVLKELLIRGLAVQIYYVFYDLGQGYGLSDRVQDTRARENIRLLLLHNLPKHLVVTAVVGRIPFPGTTEALRSVLYNDPKLWKYWNMKFQTREDIPVDIAVGKLKQYGYQLMIILNAVA